MASTTLTDKTIKNIKPGKNTIRIRDNSSDPSLKGFALQVLPSGLKTFILSYTSPETNKRRFMKLGTYPTISLKHGRESARNARSLIEQNIDPVEDAKQKQVDLLEKQKIENSQGTVDQLFEFYIKDLDLDHKRSVKQVKAIFIRDISPIIGRLKTSSINSDHISDIIAIIENRGAPTLANRTRSYLRAAFYFGRDCKTSPRWKRNKHIPEFNITINPVLDTVKAKGENRAGHNFLSKEDVQKLWKSIGIDAMSADLALAIKLILSTGQRVEEILGATWDEFNTDELLWSIPANRRKNRAKNISKEPHLVPLTSFHTQLLEEVKVYSGRSKFLFPHIDGRKPKTSDALSQAVYRFCSPQGKSTREGFTKFTPRDLRRTWKTLAGSISIDLETRNKIQGHALQDVGSIHYDRYDYMKEKREGMEQWSNWLSDLTYHKNASKT